MQVIVVRTPSNLKWPSFVTTQGFQWWSQVAMGWVTGWKGPMDTAKPHRLMLGEKVAFQKKKNDTEIKLVAAQSFYPTFQSLWCRRVLCRLLKEKPGCQASHRILYLQCVLPEKCEVAVVVQNLWKWPTNVWFNLKNHFQTILRHTLTK